MVRKVINLKYLAAIEIYFLSPANPVVLVQVADARPPPKFMNTTWFSNALKQAARVLIVASTLGGAAFAQQTLAMLHPEAIELPPAVVMANPRVPEAPRQHKFWDTENRLLFTAAAASAGADFAVTHANLQRGGQELNPMTRIFSGTTGGLAVNFAGETAGVVGLSYFFHRTGHHRLERVVPMINIGASAVAVTYGLAHR